MRLFSRVKDAPAPTASAINHYERHPSDGRKAPNLDRQRLLAATIGNPRKFWEEALAARYDLDTIQMCARPVQQDVGTSTLIALKGGHWTKEEIALQNAISQCRRDLDAGIGSAKECLDQGQVSGHAGLNDQIRDASIHWRELIKAWQAYRTRQGRTWVSRVLPQIGDAAGKVLGLI